MCGIGGIVNYKSPNISASSLKLMADKVRHRGPDDEGYLFWGQKTEDIPLNNAEFLNDKSVPFSIGLCHRRLSIIDLSDMGRQPMPSTDGRYWLTYNGEIYNYIELREELKYKYKFKTQTDSEVIIAAYHVWGESCLNKFNGMWSFAILDTQTKKLFCARDRFGIKPFYYAKSDKVFAFGSEIKQLLEFVNPQAHFEVVSQFVAYGDVNTFEQTSIEGILQLMPGHKLTIDLQDNSNFKTVEYYNLKEKVNPSGTVMDFDQYVDEFSFLFTEAVRLRMRSDVEVGTCLSGGLDSSSIVAIANKFTDKPMKTFTSCFSDPEYDEWNYAEEVVKKIGADSHRVFPDLSKMKQELDALIWHQDEPFRTSSTYAQWCVMRLANEKGIKVLLDGQGADEALSGYHWYIPLYLGELLRQGKVLSTLEKFKQLKSTGVLTASEGLSRTLAKSLYYFLDSSFRNQRVKNQFLSKKLEFKRQLGFFNSVEENQIQDLTRNLSSLLRYEDRNSMAFSIESRTPFLDYRLVEFLINVKLDNRFEKGWTKSILRHSMEKILPSNVVWRKDKKGFVTPQKIFLESLYSKKFSDVLHCEETGRWFNLDELQKGFSQKSIPESTFWSAYCIDRWLQIFMLK